MNELTSRTNEPGEQSGWINFIYIVYSIKENPLLHSSSYIKKLSKNFKK
jgi:hypothetical protein